MTFYHSFYTRALSLPLILLFFLISAMDAFAAEPFPNISISGVIEAEISQGHRRFDDPAKEKVNEGDINLSTIELAIDSELHKSVTGHIQLLWEEGETDEVQDLLDEGTITIQNLEKCPYSLTVGKMYLPFGVFETAFITDPMTLDLGEINNTAVEILYQKGKATTSLGFFNGEADKTGEDDTIKSYFASLTMEQAQGQYNFLLNVSYLSNIADTDGLEGAIDPNTGLEDYVQGMGVFMKADIGPTFIIAEYLGAIEDFDQKVFSQTLRPQAYNFEIGWRTPKLLIMAVKYEKGKDTEDFGLAGERYGIALSYPLFEALSLNVEYLHEKYKRVDRGENDLLTTQISLEF